MKLTHLVRCFVCNTWVANKSNDLIRSLKKLLLTPMVTKANEKYNFVMNAYFCLQLTRILKLVAHSSHTNVHSSTLICFLVNFHMFQAYPCCALPLIYFMCDA